MRSNQRSRRGSTLVMVALMLSVFMGIAAIAADIGRFYVVNGELQTAADAAALRGAAELQFATTDFESRVEAAVLPWTRTTNRADGDSVTITDGDVDVGYWDPATRAYSTTLVAGTRPNAVRVSTRRSPRGVFSQMIGRTAGLPLTKTAIAWIANISTNCARPWAFQYLPLVQKVNGNTDTTKNLDMARFASYQATDASNRTLVYHNSEVGAGPTDDGVYTAYNLPNNSSGNANAGKITYQSQIAGCGNIAMFADAGNGSVQPSTGNCAGGESQTIVCWALEALEFGLQQGQYNLPGLCNFVDGNATCFNKTTGAGGVTMDIAFANTASNGANGIDFKYVGETTLMCVFKMATDVCNAIPDPRQKSGYPIGTMVLVTQGLKSRTLNPANDVLSNSPSNLQRFILVK